MMRLIDGISTPIPMATVVKITLTLDMQVFDPSLHLSEVSEIVQTIYFLEVLQHFKDDTVDFPTVFQNI